MTAMNETIEEQAIAWVIRLRSADAEDWEAFTLWLEADPARAAAYEEAALADAEIEALPTARPRPILPAAPAVERRWLTRRTAFAGGIAAALVGAIAITTLPGGGST